MVCACLAEMASLPDEGLDEMPELVGQDEGLLGQDEGLVGYDGQ